MDKKEIELETRVTFLTNRLLITPDILGMRHEFPYKGAIVTITLPVAEQVAIRPELDEYPAATRRTYRTEDDGTEVTLEIEISRVYVTVRQGFRFAFAPVVFTKPINAYNDISEADQDKIRALAAKGHDFASNAFEYWLTVLRWLGDDYRIGRRGIEADTTGTASLHAVETGRKMWSWARPLVVSWVHPISADIWNRMSFLLEAAEKVPTYIALLQDAEDYQNRGEYRRAMIDIAIACEVFLRSNVLRTLPAELDGDLVTVIEQANINQCASKHFPNLLAEAAKQEYKPLIKELASLFDARNKIMHMADDERATDESCTRFIALAKKLYEFGNKVK